ncbi:hypothetical protein [Bacillus taeanensis]|uniref:Uncharacterized protein n=1 Tax=Bacillus taeanensis TaxID=273032 RepID=A0A366XTC8_9BACI|nr:hypothetical protein [Bacillus taeanensis]RBW67999.1 hypothetical protein DS031_18850 [Bacillus taeanensis]
MNKEMLKKIENVKSGKSKSEIFDKLRPPEDFGDAVELYYNNDDESFRAIVFDPETKMVFSEERLSTTEDVSEFINKTVK